ELGHVWHLENLLQRSFLLDRATREAFCELLAYLLMADLHEPFEMSVIEANLYTCGQIDLLLACEKEYGFYKVLEWMKNGSDLTLTAANLERISVLNASASMAGWSWGGIVAAPVKVPDKLMLKGIMGTGKKRMVLLNNQTFEVSERAKVKVAQT